VVAEKKPIETLELVLSQYVVVLVDRTFFHALPFLHIWSALALHTFTPTMLNYTAAAVWLQKTDIPLWQQRWTMRFQILTAKILFNLLCL